MLPQNPQGQAPAQDQASFAQGDVEAQIAYLMRSLSISREEAIAMLRQRMQQGQPQPQTLQRPQQGGAAAPPLGALPV